MSQGVHSLTKNLLDYVPLERRCLPYSGLSGRVIAISPCFRVDHRFCSHLRTGSVKYALKATSIVCKGSSGGQWGNSDFPKQNRRSFSGNRNRQNEDRNIFDNIDESAQFTSKNGSLLSLPNTSKFQSHLPRERAKHIVGLFKKVLTELGSRAAAKGGKKVEAAQGNREEEEYIRSMLQLLKKHKIDESIKKSSGINSDLATNQDKQSESFREAKTKRFLNSNKKARNSGTKPRVPSSSRPPPNFQLKSPVPRMKFQPIYSSEDSVESATHLIPSDERKQQFETLPDVAQLPDLELEVMPQPELESSLTDENVFNEPSEGDDASVTDQSRENQQQQSEEDLSSMNVPELRATAKSRGLKGYSKMKKNELLELLGG